MRTPIFLLALLLSLAACSDDGGDSNGQTGTDAGTTANDASTDADIVVPEGTSVRFELASEDFFDVPFPADARLAEDGSFDMTGWESAYDISLVKLWFDASMDLVRGWGLVSGVFASFETGIDESTLPDLAQSAGSEGFPSVALVDIDPVSPERGRLLPLYCRYKADEGTLHPASFLACRSPFGVVRRPNTKYAFVVTNRVLDAEGDPVVPSADMASLLAGRDTGGVTAAPYVAALGELESVGLESDEVAHLTLITTGDPTARLRLVNEFYDGLPDPEIDTSQPLEVVEEYDDYVVVQGYYEVPNIQDGTKPYDMVPDGKIVFGDDGEIELQAMESIRFFVTIPKAAMPAGGWPIMVYMHGSGGTSRELIDRGAKPTIELPAPAGSGPADTLADYEWAGFSADFPFHDSRFSPPDQTGLKLYNLLNNPRATIDNFIVSANEVTFHARLLKNMTIDPSIDPMGRLDAGGAADGLIRFNADQFGAMGQSMGSTLGIPAATIDQNIDALVPSGAGGVLIEVASTGTKPVNLSGILPSVFRYKPGEPVDQFDPVLHAIQHLWDFVDPVVHSRHVFAEPYGDTPPKHVYMSAGLLDGYFSPEAQAGVTAGMGLEFTGPVLEDRILVAMGYEGVGETKGFPQSGNGANGVTAAVTQHNPEVLDGHNVTFQLDEVKAIYGCFFKTLATGTPEVRAPENATPEMCP